MSENGHQPLDDARGGKGAVLLADLMRPGVAKSTAGMIIRAIKYGYLDIFGIDYAATKRAAEKLRDSPDERMSRAGTLLCAMLANHDLKLWELVDKTNRLDVGDPTERVEHGGALKIIEGIPEDAV